IISGSFGGTGGGGGGSSLKGGGGGDTEESSFGPLVSSAGLIFTLLAPLLLTVLFSLAVLLFLVIPSSTSGGGLSGSGGGGKPIPWDEAAVLLRHPTRNEASDDNRIHWILIIQNGEAKPPLPFRKLDDMRLGTPHGETLEARDPSDFALTKRSEPWNRFWRLPPTKALRS
ncbi:Cysteine--tRNA ligase, partial [Orchesella cincta]